MVSPTIPAVSLALFFAVTLAAQPFTPVAVPMRDGVTLPTHVYRPPGPGPFPVILTRTPSDLAARLTQPGPLATAGYAIVLQNLRGPTFGPEITDGEDTLNWIAAQPWCNGKIGYLGSSAAAVAGYLAAMSGSTKLTAAVLIVGHADPYFIAEFPGGVWQQHANETWLRSRGIETPAFPRPILRRYDAKDRKQELAPVAEKVRTAILHIGGWFDVYSQGTIDAFNSLQLHGGDRARGNQKLLMRPLAHAGALDSPTKFPDAEVDLLAAQLRWFDYWLKGVENGLRQEPAVRYYSMNEGWRVANVWPPLTKPISYYLQPSGLLAPSLPPRMGASASYVYNPLDPVPTLGGNNLGLPSGPFDQRPVSRRPDVLRFESNVLSAPLRLVGPVRAELFVATSARDTDFHVKLIDIAPDGAELLLLDRPARLRHRDGIEKSLRAKPNEVYKLNVDLWSTAIVIPAGHRLAVHVSSSNSPRFDRHPNTWEPITDWAQAIPATNTVHFSERYPSRLILPVAAK